jgi:hypothetical protein
LTGEGRCPGRGPIMRRRMPIRLQTAEVYSASVSHAQAESIAWDCARA